MQFFFRLRDWPVADLEPEVYAEAPGRVEILGNHTDYNEGLVLGAAIDRAVRLRISARADGRISVKSTRLRQGYGGQASYTPVEANISDLQPQSGDARWANYVLGVASELIASGVPIAGFSADIDSNLPVGAGLGSSAAVAVAAAFGLLKLSRRELELLEMAKLCQCAEHNFGRVQSGLLDQVMSIFGKANHLLCFDCRSYDLRAIRFPREFAFIVADSGIKRELAASNYKERRNETRMATQALCIRALRDVSMAHLNALSDFDPLLRRRATHVVEENDRVRLACDLVARGDGRGLGELMNASHESSRINFENSTPELDQLVDLARKQAGVFGARLTGGGFGGAIIALCEAAAAERASQCLNSACAGAFVCHPSDGARLL